MKSTCHIRYCGYPQQGFTDLFEYTRILSKKYSVTVICKNMGNQKNFEEINNIKVYRINTPFQNDNLFNLIIFDIKTILILLKHKRFDIYHIYENTKLFFLPLLFFGKSKWIYDIKSIKYIKFRNNLINIFHKLSFFFYDSVCTLNTQMGDKLFKSKNYFILPLGVNSKLFFKGKNLRKKFRLKLGLNKNYVILYSGSLNKKRRLDQLIKSFKIFSKKYRDAKLIFLGEGDAKSELIKLARFLGIISKVKFLSSIKYRDIPAYLSTADILISYIPIEDDYNLQPPLKTVEYLTMGVPIIATNTVGNRYYIKNGKNGILIEDSYKELAKGMLKIRKNKILNKKILKNYKRYLKKNDYNFIVNNILVKIYET